MKYPTAPQCNAQAITELLVVWRELLSMEEAMLRVLPLLHKLPA
jgi:hypothetical protein